MKNSNNKIIGVVHLGKREKSGFQIIEKLKQHDFEVIQWDVNDEKDRLNKIDSVSIVILNIGNIEFEYDDLFNKILDLDIEVIINEALLSNQLSGNKRQSWERHLLHKVDSTFSVLPEYNEGQHEIKEITDITQYGFEQVWILAASIGGPEAIQAFLTEFTGDDSVLFIIIQHMDKEFVPMMQKQFNNGTNIKIDIPLSGMKVEDTQCLIQPVDEFITFDDNKINLTAMNKVFAFTPCIDECTKHLAETIKDINIAVFSGMSSDGVVAAQIIKDKGNKVITQTEESCVLSSIISGVKSNLKVDFDGVPHEMAQYIIKNL